MKTGLGLMAFAFLLGTAALTDRVEAAVFTFDSPGEVVLSSTPAAGTWYTDRYAPAGFASGQVGGFRDGVLLETIGVEQSAANRPAAFSDAFYNTQGRKYDLAPGTNALFIDLYVSKSWDDLTQIGGRLASFWATGANAGGIANGMFPVLEFDNNRAGDGSDGFRMWDSNAGWVNVNGFAGYDQWYRIGFTISGGEERFYVNGNFVGYVDDPLTTQFANVILQGYNSGNAYSIAWDNLAATPNPEPATLAIFGLSFAGFGLFAMRRRAAR